MTNGAKNIIDAKTSLPDSLGDYYSKRETTLSLMGGLIIELSLITQMIDFLYLFLPSCSIAITTWHIALIKP